MMSSTQANTNYSEPEYAKSQDRAKMPYYTVDIANHLVPETQDLLEKYSKIPRDQQIEHVHFIRDKAWDIRAYPCIGLGVWLTPQLCRLPVYESILARVKNGAVLMDVGTFIGHDLRRLVYDGAPSEKVIGVDIVNHFDLGYEFFCDLGRFHGQFIEADFLSSSPELMALKGQIDIILVSQLLHQWDWDNQVKALETLISFTKPGSSIVGNQIGNQVAQSVAVEQLPSVVTWRHNQKSFAQMFEEAGKATGSH
ncbi:hypothetical protein FHL15_011117 [Xylaria flabelliformis]|uniref:Methyltransferase domain-containing protein n=1 Tax=Xylaria flabelliformis TaxID=2512241 RepID=A0A553HJ49_9PEZI|nr:hypothetical protein FHL15_011117 [Xylaria flabelliformis]